jgi:hypothetical protein
MVGYLAVLPPLRLSSQHTLAPSDAASPLRWLLLEHNHDSRQHPLYPDHPAHRNRVGGQLAEDTNSRNLIAILTRLSWETSVSVHGIRPTTGRKCWVTVPLIAAITQKEARMERGVRMAGQQRTVRVMESPRTTPTARKHTGDGNVIARQCLTGCMSARVASSIRRNLSRGGSMSACARSAGQYQGTRCTSIPRAKEGSPCHRGHHQNQRGGSELAAGKRWLKKLSKIKGNGAYGR